jgi:putative endopeptidase
MNKVAFREAELRKAALSGVHSPSKWRTWAVRNHDAWYAAFNVAPGDKHYLAPAERVKIWE